MNANEGKEKEGTAERKASTELEVQLQNTKSGFIG
jgi:hypothetical protein